MAAINPTERRKAGHIVFTWSGLTENDTAVAVELGDYADRSIHVSGSFGGGGVSVEGSNNNGSSYATLTDPQGNPLVITSEKIEQISEIVEMLRPRVSSGSSVAVNVSLIVRLGR